MSTRNHLPNTVEASLGARLAPFNGIPATPLEDLDAEVSRAVAPRPERLLRLRLVNDLKLLFAALGAWIASPFRRGQVVAAPAGFDGMAVEVPEGTDSSKRYIVSKDAGLKEKEANGVTVVSRRDAAE